MTRLLLVDDDDVFRRRLARAMVKRGCEVFEAARPSDALAMAKAHAPQRAVVDLRMPGGSGLDVVSELAALDPAPKILVLTGFGSIGTALEAVRRGAVNFLQKPADADQVLAAFGGEPTIPTLETPSLALVEWEHIQRVLQACDGNISEAARQLGVHRRSLQRKIERLAPKR
jgi:two-component system, response regulator RegA